MPQPSTARPNAGTAKRNTGETKITKPIKLNKIRAPKTIWAIANLISSPSPFILERLRPSLTFLFGVFKRGETPLFNILPPLL
jgi:hypothetical protein